MYSEYDYIILASMSIRLESTVGARGQTVIPKAIRDRLGLRPGQKVWFRLEGEQVVIEREDPSAILEAFINECEKRPLPKDIDWDAVYESQLEERWRKTQRG